MRGPALTLPAALSRPPEPVCPQPPRAPEPRVRSPRARLRARAPRVCGTAARRRDGAMLHPYGRDEPFRERWLPGPMHCRALPTRPEREVLSTVAQLPSRAFWLFLPDPAGCPRLSSPSARDLRAHRLDRLRARGHLPDLPALAFVPDDDPCQPCDGEDDRAPLEDAQAPLDPALMAPRRKGKAENHEKALGSQSEIPCFA